MSASCAAALEPQYRSDAATRALLGSLQPKLDVQHSTAHGRNDCLTDSILQALADQGLLKPLSGEVRDALCLQVRHHLEKSHNLSPCNYPFLSHDHHFHPICQILRQTLGQLWISDPSYTSFTCIVYDRFNRQLVEDDVGELSEIPETNPVYSAAPTKESTMVVILLYCNTDEFGKGWHYEWIRTRHALHSNTSHCALGTPVPRSAPSSESDSKVEHVVHSDRNDRHLASDGVTVTSSTGVTLPLLDDSESNITTSLPAPTVPPQYARDMTPPSPPRSFQHRRQCKPHTHGSKIHLSTSWSGGKHPAGDACIACTGSKHQDAPSDQQLGDRLGHTHPKRRRILKKSAPNTEFEKLPRKGTLPPTGDPMEDKEEDNDDTDTSTSSTDPDAQKEAATMKCRRIRRMGIPEDEFGHLIMPQVTQPNYYAAYTSEEESDATDTGTSSTEEGDDMDATVPDISYPLRVTPIGGQVVERDQLMRCSRELATHMRARPTLPASTSDCEQSFDDVESAIRLPLFSCPFRSCTYATDERAAFLSHLASASETSTSHYNLVSKICSRFFSIASPLHFVYNAISTIERQQIPLIGMATTRRALRQLTKVYNDESTKALVCFVCGEIHCTMRGPEPFEAESPGHAITAISYRNLAWFRYVESTFPGSLLNNCSYELWEKRYVTGHYAQAGDDDQHRVLEHTSPGPPNTHPPDRHLSEWCLRLQLRTESEHEVRLFGVTEDVVCQRQSFHMGESDQSPFCRKLCNSCQVPICERCRRGLTSYAAEADSGTIPMAIANDNYYGYALKLLVQKRITWLECAAASLVWTTIMVYYLEAPYGHLMLEELEGARARTTARGNLFSFELPWEDVAERCRDAQKQWKTARSAAYNSCRLPHDENVLATLVNVHIVGGSAEAVSELQGATMRTAVVLALISELRKSGYPGYRSEFNSEALVRERAKEIYGRYGDEAFVPDKIREATKEAFRAKLSGPSLLSDKRSTPEEPSCPTQELMDGMRPLSLVDEASGKSASRAHLEQESVLARYQTLEVTTGNTLLDQFQPQYLGLAHPFTLPVAVGGYDIPKKTRWRRPDTERLALQGGVPIADTRFSKQPQVSAAQVKLFDITRSLSRRIEAQFRRHWHFVPGLWNLYFRNAVNQGASLGVGTSMKPEEPQEETHQDAAMAAGALYDALHNGFYRTPYGDKRRIDGDLTKLHFAEGITKQQKRLLADYRFRTRLIPGTQEIRTTLGHVCFWSSVVYGSGIFMTVTPGERHAYLAIRLSRYRQRDPYVTSEGSEPREKQWIGAGMPSLQARTQDAFECEIPGYDLRRLILARDPLAASLAFGVQIRLVLATVLGFRMCPECPHCATSAHPCMDAFGSCAEAMGGIAGRCDGIAGAVECQKAKGTLHLHFWCYVQRLHQYKSLEEIGKLLEDELVEAADLKRFVEHLCNESYPLSDGLANEIDELERRWPCFKETDDATQTEPRTWGEHRIGRIPPFIWQDSGTTYSDINPSTSPSEMSALHTDARTYEQHFARALQENLKSVQHHIHPKHGDGSQKRTIPSTCLSSKSGKECKAGFPMENRMHSGPPVLICKGLAKQKNLPWKGRRSMLGHILGRRNNPWLNGTAPGLAIALSGSNTDVKINDLLPITATTHENEICEQRCIPKDSAKRQRVLRRLAQRVTKIQSQRNGYFGGYICKRQRIGKTEIRKCINKMQKLRELNHDKSQYQQQRAVSGRMITDIEMNGTVRGAVEEFNLCTNLHGNDALFAECIRSFASVTTDAQNWLYRMQVETDKVAKKQITAMVPGNKRPHLRGRQPIPDVDIYGFRPLDTPFGHLCAFEFLRYWTAEPLEPPSRSDPHPRTEWTTEGRKLRGTAEFKNGNVKLSPGKHYRVIEQKTPGANGYWTFPSEPERVYKVLRHSWVIVRRPRPYVPVLIGAKVPDGATQPEETAKYLSAFFRPWTCCPQTSSGKKQVIGSVVRQADIPSLAMLGWQHLQDGAPHTLTGGLNTSKESKERKDGKPSSSDGPQNAAVTNVPDYAYSWSAYLQTGVHSEETAQLIQNLLTKTLPTGDNDEQDDDKEAGSDAGEEIPALQWQPGDMRALLQQSQPHETNVEQPKKRISRKKSSHVQALSIVETMWGESANHLTNTDKKDSGPRYIREAAEHIAARSNGKNEKKEVRPYAENRVPSATLHPAQAGGDLEAWLRSLQERPEKPTIQQLEVLRTIVDRIKEEAKTEQSEKKPRYSTSEPLFDMAHGQPGCGKSRLIAWIREAFEEVLGWQHGVQFVCLAFQNTMAAQIAGETIHHWSGIPVSEIDGNAGPRDPNKLAAKCQLVRWILIDEISMISAQLFGQLHFAVQKAIPLRSPFLRKEDRKIRPFGGMNVLLFGDMWQLKPVTSQALWTPPWETKSQTAHAGATLLWERLRRCWVLTGSQRCRDAWYNNVLRQCRDGHLTEDSHWYLHGIPTGTPVCYSEDAETTNSCSCLHGSTSIETARKDFVATYNPDEQDALHLYVPWAKRFVDEGATGDDLVASECVSCQCKRLARNRIFSSSTHHHDSSHIQEKPWDTAPALYARNIPRYYALLQRARMFARINREKLHWTVAQDTPLNREDRELPPDQLDAKRRQWQKLHDQATGHVVGQVPLAVGLPMRLTATVDHERQLFRGRRCRIVGWAPHPKEERLDVDGEWLLTKMPQIIYLHFEDARWTIHPELGKGVYPLTPVMRKWMVNKRTKVYVKRTGFLIVPDFASTSHMIQGQSLFAAFVDLVTGDETEKPTDDTQVSGYVMMSRARDPMNMWLLRPFPRELFTRGPPSGPHILLKMMCGDIKPAQVKAEWKRIEEEKEEKTAATEVDHMKRLYRCTQCMLTNRKPFMKPAVAFGANCAAEVWGCIHRQGAWSRCLVCQEVASSRRGHVNTPSTRCVDPNGITCGSCHLRRPLHYYDKSAQKNRNVQDKLYCNACKGSLRCPRCTLWKSKTDFRNGAESCKTCQTITCAGCGEKKAQAQYDHWDIQNFFHHKINVRCRSCLKKGAEKKSGEKAHKGEHQRRDRQCDTCKEYKNQRSFRWCKTGRVDVCTSCELMKCRVCATMLPQSSFRRVDRSHHFKDGQQITCLTCREEEDKREKQLKERMKKSRRPGCTCKHPNNHTEKCPMHIRHAGEKPFPGCDVLTRAESEWLQKRKPNQYSYSKKTGKPKG